MNYVAPGQVIRELINCFPCNKLLYPRGITRIAIIHDALVTFDGRLPGVYYVGRYHGCAAGVVDEKPWTEDVTIASLRSAQTEVRLFAISLLEYLVEVSDLVQYFSLDIKAEARANRNIEPLPCFAI